MANAPKRATLEDFLALPGDARAELIEGTIVHLPPPLPEHGLAQRGLANFIGGPFHDEHGRGGPGGWWILTEVDVMIGREVVRPDLVGWRRERVLEAFALEDGGWKRVGGWRAGDRARSQPFDAIELEVGRLFPPTEG